MIVSAGISVVGRREQNQDCIYAHPKGSLFIVADGMGGESCGERASALTVQIMKDFFEAAAEGNDPSWPFGHNDAISLDENAVPFWLQDQGCLANREVRHEGELRQECRGMGATVVAACVSESIMTLGSIGDCRAYLLRHNVLTQVTTDDTVIQRLLEEGSITPEEAPTHPLRHQVTAAIGASETIEVQTFEIPLEAGDRLLLCSDGVHGVVSDAQILNQIGSGLQLTNAVEELAALVDGQGGTDNTSCILIEYRGHNAGSTGSL